MDPILALLLMLSLWTMSLALFAVGWLYGDEHLPSPGIVLDDLRALRTMLLILHAGDDALQQMLAEAQRQQ